MYAHSNSNNIPFSTPFLLPSSSPFMEHIPDFTELDTLSQLNNSELSSGYSSYGGSPSPSTPILMQRSISSHSLQYNNGTHHYPLSAFFAELLDSDDAPVRKVCSTGDLQVHYAHCFKLQLRSHFNNFRGVRNRVFFKKMCFKTYKAFKKIIATTLTLSNFSN